MMLEEIDFCFDCQPSHSRRRKFTPKEIERWNTMLALLKEFRAEYGHCNVPFKYNPNPSLGHWVKKQRDDYREQVIDVERLEKLNELEFVWCPLSDGQQSKKWVNI